MSRRFVVRVLVGILLIMGLTMACKNGQDLGAFSGERALEHIRTQVALGPRPPGSAASARLRAWLRGQLEPLGFQIDEQPFQARTPLGRVPMVNVVATLPGSDPATLVLGAHYDTKLFNEFAFVGANDGASGVAALVELGRVLHLRPLRHTLRLVFFDGEEALVEWGPDDGLYGSTHLVDSWVESGRARGITAVFVLDMVADRRLRISDEINSHPPLRTMLRQQAAHLGYGTVFSGPAVGVDDDHVPFLMAGIPAVNVIGFAAGADAVYPSYWHTAEDTLDKVGAPSLQAVGRTVEACLRRLDSDRP